MQDNQQFPTIEEAIQVRQKRQRTTNTDASVNTNDTNDTNNDTLPYPESLLVQLEQMMHDRLLQQQSEQMNYFDFLDRLMVQNINQLLRGIQQLSQKKNKDKMVNIQQVTFAEQTEHKCFCLQNFEPQQTIYQTQCNHFFHIECLDKWETTQNKDVLFMSNQNTPCPYCRQKL